MFLEAMRPLVVAVRETGVEFSRSGGGQTVNQSSVQRQLEDSAAQTMFITAKDRPTICYREELRALEHAMSLGRQAHRNGWNKQRFAKEYGDFLRDSKLKFSTPEQDHRYPTGIERRRERKIACCAA
ncbi:hypothetical protein LTR37_020137 [Vermiconidia calcicola]|uniref:Uncharacterized protein n=1 Tax=Vermiconidia calcicola TaxID=1690605 RepID=A0ACC3MC53_9PEZI|nr:hypothetical protein LTR37_020137 [Vermiconidia calcicola]